MGIELTKEEKAARLMDLQQRVLQSDSRKTTTGKFRKMMLKLKRNQVGKERAVASKNYGFAGMEYGESKSAARANDSYLQLPAELVLVVIDCETAGFSVYDDTIVELAAASMTCRIDKDGTMTAENERRFHAVSQVHAVNPGVPGTAHLDLTALKAAPVEDDLVSRFVDFLGAAQDGGRPVVLMAHNAGFDVSLLAQALRRAKKTTTELLEEARVLGVVDTLAVCRTINWDSSIEEAQALLREADDRHVGPSVSAVAAHVLSAYRAAAVDAAKKKAAVDAPSAPAVSEEDTEMGEEGETAPQDGTKDIAGAQELDKFNLLWEDPEWHDAGQGSGKHGNALGEVYKRLKGTRLESAHSAQVDVEALLDVIGCPKIITTLLSKPFVRPAQAAFAHVDALYAKRVQKYLGWEVHSSEWPSCEHGKLLAEVVPANEHEDVPRLRFRCRNVGLQCDLGAAPTYGPTEGWQPAPEKAKKRLIKKTKAERVLGSCGCPGKCQRSCPCRKAAAACTPTCHPLASECRNTPSAASVAAPSAAPAAAPVEAPVAAPGPVVAPVAAPGPIAAPVAAQGPGEVLHGGLVVVPAPTPAPAVPRTTSRGRMLVPTGRYTK
jgi:hypothetical protein